jgi:RNA polymerase sigma factor (sigma-70 family)
MPGSGELDEMITAAIRGDRSAFACLLEREGPTAYRAALAILRSPDGARDAVQEAAIRAWEGLSDLRAASAWPTWFRRIAIRAALDESRRARSSREVTMPLDLRASHPDPAPAIEERVSILMALERLPPGDRAILGLRFGADLTVPDIATALDLRLGTAKARLNRALVRLRAELGDDNE